METSKSLTSVLWQKFVAFVEDSTSSRLGAYLGFCILAGLLPAAWINFTAFGNLLIGRSLWHNNAVGKIALAFVVAFAGKRIGWWFYSTLFRLVFTLSGNETQDGIEGIPTTELLDWLYENKSFRGDDVEQHFGVRRKRITALTTKLRSIGVLVPGPNNLGVLNPEYTRANLASIFTGKSQASQLEPLARTTDTGVSFRPSAPEIEERWTPFPDYEPILHIVPRYHAGTLEKDVELSRGKVGTDIQLKGATPEHTMLLISALAQKTSHGMKAMRAHVNCWETPMNCGNQGWQPSK